MDLAPLGAVDDPTDAALVLDDPLGALVLALMSRLRASRAVGALADGDGWRVEVVKGRVGLAPGDRLAPDDARLADAGLTQLIPLQHAGQSVGVVALGAWLGGGGARPAELGIARSLANATAASLAARRSAAELGRANRALAARAQALRTLFELAQAFGRVLDRDAIAGRLGLALMGQLMTHRLAIGLCDGESADESHLAVGWARGAGPYLALARPLADLAGPSPAPPELAEDGWDWVVPLRAGDVTRGAAVLGPLAGGALDADQSDFAAALAALAVGALETADRVEERLERERMREEVRLAREVQARLLPTTLPAVPGLEVAATWRPSRDVSGDTYDAVDLGGGRLLVAVADVVGKGIGASLLMATVQAGFRLVQPDLEGADDPGAALVRTTTRLDRLISASTEPHQFVTLAWAIVDAATGTVWAVVAGHPPPRIVGDGGVRQLDVSGPLLGVLPDAAFRVTAATLAPGQALVLFTDGVTEAQNAAGDELGADGLDRVLAHAPRQPDALIESIVQAADDWADGSTEDDDLTLVAVGR